MKFFKLLIAVMLATLGHNPFMQAMKRAGGNRVMALIPFETVQNEVDNAQNISDFEGATNLVIEFSNNRIPDNQIQIQAAALQETLKNKILAAIENQKDIITSLTFPEGIDFSNFDAGDEIEEIKSDPIIQTLDALFNKLDALQDAHN